MRWKFVKRLLMKQINWKWYKLCVICLQRIYIIFFVDEKWIFMTIISIMFFWRSRVVFKNILIVIFFLLYSRLFCELHNMKSCKIFSLLIKAYIINFFLIDLYRNWNLFLLNSWNLIVDSFIAKWFSKTINKNN